MGKKKSKKSSKNKKNKETLNKEHIEYSNSYKYNVNDFIIVSDTYREDKEKYKDLKKKIENKELKLEFYSMGHSYYKKQK